VQRPQKQKLATTSWRLATVAAALLASRLLAPAVSSAAAGVFDLCITLPEQSSEEAEAEAEVRAPRGTSCG